MRLDYVDVKTGKSKSQTELEKTLKEREDLKKQVEKIDSVLLQVLLTVGKLGGKSNV